MIDQTTRAAHLDAARAARAAREVASGGSGTLSEILRVDGLVKQFGGNRAVDGASFTVKARHPIKFDDSFR